MVEFKESKFYKLLQDFFINNDKETFTQFLAEFYNRTEGIIIKNDMQDELIKELREMFLLFNEEGIDENIIREKVNQYLENNEVIENISTQLENNIYDFSTLIGNGVIDETKILQQIFDNIKPNSRVQFPKGKKIKISKPIELKVDNVIIDGNNCELIWNNTTNSINNTSIRETWNGFFNIHGYETTTKTTVLGYKTNEEPVINGKWKVADSSGFKENDYVYINIKGGYETTNFIDSYNPSYMVLAKVVKVESDYITTDYYTPFHMENFNWGLRPCEIIKVITRDNITIENFILNDIVPWENFTSNDGRDRDKVACGIGTDYASNIIIRNIKGKRNKFPTVMLNRTHNFEVDNVVGLDPSYVGPAEGYSVKVNRSCYGTVSNVYGKNGRHVLDCSWSAFVDVNNCYNVSKNYQSNGSNGSFDLHGICEHNINFYNCNGDFVFGNGFSSFPMLMKNITIDNCNGRGSFYNTENLLVVNSNITLTNAGETEESGNISVKFSNCDIKYGRSYTFRGRKRGTNLKTSLIIENCNIQEYIPATTGVWINNIDKFDEIKINGNDIDFTRSSQLLKFVNSGQIEFNNNKLKGLMIQFELSKENYFNYNINNNNFLITDSDLIVSDTKEVDIIRLLRIKNSIGDIIINDNIFRTHQTRELTIVNTNIPDETPFNNNIKVFFEKNKVLPNKNNNTKLLLPTKTGVSVYSNNNYLDHKIINYNTLITEQLEYYTSPADKTIGKSIKITKDNALLLLQDMNNNGFQIRNTQDTLSIISILNGVFGENLIEIDRNKNFTRIKSKALKLPLSTSSSAPTPELGGMYFDYETKKFKKCIDGTTWVDANI